MYTVTWAGKYIPNHLAVTGWAAGSIRLLTIISTTSFLKAITGCIFFGGTAGWVPFVMIMRQGLKPCMSVNREWAATINNCIYNSFATFLYFFYFSLLSDHCLPLTY